MGESIGKQGGDGEWCGKWPVRGVLIRVNLIIKFIIH